MATSLRPHFLDHPTQWKRKLVWNYDTTVGVLAESGWTATVGCLLRSADVCLSRA